jgi:hypothetical protein
MSLELDLVSQVMHLREGEVEPGDEAKVVRLERKLSDWKRDGVDRVGKELSTPSKEDYQHPSLAKINSDPAYTSLARLEKECKANGKSIQSTLGGGNQGHLRLVSSVLAYERVSPGVPFERPVLPVLPNLTNGTTA